MCVETSVRIMEAIAETLNIDESEVDESMNFVDDFGLDEMELSGLFVALEKKFDINVSDEDMEELTTVGEAIDYIEDNMDPESDDLVTLGDDVGALDD